MYVLVLKWVTSMSRFATSDLCYYLGALSGGYREDKTALSVICAEQSRCTPKVRHIRQDRP